MSVRNRAERRHHAFRIREKRKNYHAVKGGGPSCVETPCPSSRFNHEDKSYTPKCELIARMREVEQVEEAA